MRLIYVFLQHRLSNKYKYVLEHCVYSQSWKVEEQHLHEMSSLIS